RLRSPRQRPPPITTKPTAPSSRSRARSARVFDDLGHDLLGLLDVDAQVELHAGQRLVGPPGGLVVRLAWRHHALARERLRYLDDQRFPVEHRPPPSRLEV